MFTKCWLVKRHMPASGTDVWVFTTKHQQPVSVLGQVGAFSFSSWSPGQSSTSSKIYTIFCNEMSKELADQYIVHNANSNVFYMGLPESEDEHATIITTAEFKELNADDSAVASQAVAREE